MVDGNLSLSCTLKSFTSAFYFKFSSFFFISKNYNHRFIVMGVAKRGGYRYEDGTRYIGDWNSRGQKHGMGHLILAGKVNLHLSY